MEVLSSIPIDIYNPRYAGSIAKPHGLTADTTPAENENKPVAPTTLDNKP